MFISRCQNLKTEHNDQPWAGKINDGSFIYSAAAGGETKTDSPPGDLPGYGSMTYAGVKSMIYCGVSKDDPRMKKAIEWLRRHYTVEENAGMPPALKHARIVLLLSHDGEVPRRSWRRQVYRHQRRPARLAGRNHCRAGEAPTARRQLGQPDGSMDGRRPEPGHRVRADGAVVLQTKMNWFSRDAESAERSAIGYRAPLRRLRVAAKRKNTMPRHGFVRVAAAVPTLRVGDPVFNADRTLGLLERAAADGVEVVVFPEMGLTGYTCGDLFHQTTLLRTASQELDRLAKQSAAKFHGLAVVGLPVVVDDQVFNCAAVLHRGRVLGLAPKSYLPNYKEFYDARYFTAAATARSNCAAFSQRRGSAVRR